MDYSGYFQFRNCAQYRYGLNLVTPAVAEPVTVAEQKSFSRVDISTDDTLIGTLITAARQYCENHLGRRIYTQTWDLFLDRFPRETGQCFLPFGPWQSITSITYTDVSGNSQTVASTVYGLDAYDICAPRLYLKYAQYWPVERVIQNAVAIRHVSGYATVPENIKLAMKLIAGHYYETRSNSNAMKLENIPMGAKSLLAQEKQSWV
jgi:uncharacterized phiE125 gp8 family phage protein